MNFPSQHLKTSTKFTVKEWAQKKEVCERTVRRDFERLGLTKSREQCEAEAHIRRETAYNLRQQGLKYKEIAEQLGISVNNAQQLVRRYNPQM